jgi:hypothetical protein
MGAIIKKIREYFWYKITLQKIIKQRKTVFIEKDNLKFLLIFDNV